MLRPYSGGIEGLFDGAAACSCEDGVTVLRADWAAAPRFIMAKKNPTEGRALTSADDEARLGHVRGFVPEIPSADVR